MQLRRQQNLQDDQMSGAQRFSGYSHRSSQPRKISIGIMVESSPSRISEATKEHDIPAVETEKVVFENRINSGGSNNEKCTREPDVKNSPWLTTKSSCPRIPSTETNSKLPASSEGKNKLNGPQVHSPVAKTSALLSSDKNNNEFDVITYRRKPATTRRVEEQEDPLVDKPVIEDATENNGRTDNLRRKLFEILGDVTSPKSQGADLQNHGAGINNLKPKPVDKKHDSIAVPKLSSDTIEADSECPQQIIQRPVTRSLIRKKASIDVQAYKSKIDVPLSYHKKNQNSNTASFKKGRSRGLQDAVDGISSMSTKKKGKQEKSASKPLKKANSENVHAGKIHQAKHLSKMATLVEKGPSKNSVDTIQKATHRTVTPLAAEKTSSPGNHVIDTHTHPPENNREDVDLNSNKRTRNYLQCSPRWNPTPNISTFPSPISEPYQMKNIFSPEPHRKFTKGDTLSPILSSPKLNYFSCDFGSKAHDEEEELSFSMKTAGTDMEEEDSEDSHSKSSEEELDSEDSHSKSSEEELDSKSSEDGSPAVVTYSGSRKRVKSSEARNIKKETLMFSCPLKRRRSFEGFQQNESGESDWLEESPDEMQDTGLARAVGLFSLALDKFNKKMTSLTTKKCSEILVTISEGVYLQLQDVESQVYADMGKLTTLNKSKTKELESRFQEQQEQLKLMTIKFQEEVRRHLQVSKDIIEDISAQQIELKETVEKQKVSHQKIFSDLEETVDTELDDAQRRIKAVQEVARKRIFQLKQVITECLKDGLLS